MSRLLLNINVSTASNTHRTQEKGFEMAGIEKAGTDNMDIEFEDSQIKRNTTMAVC